jgi:hypothetical protein
MRILHHGERSRISFLEMFHRCRCPRVYVIVDALDECQDSGMADLLNLIVRTGLNHPGEPASKLTVST